MCRFCRWSRRAWPRWRTWTKRWASTSPSRWSRPACTTSRRSSSPPTGPESCPTCTAWSTSTRTASPSPEERLGWGYESTNSRIHTTLLQQRIQQHFSCFGHGDGEKLWFIILYIIIHSFTFFKVRVNSKMNLKYVHSTFSHIYICIHKNMKGY